MRGRDALRIGTFLFISLASASARADSPELRRLFAEGRALAQNGDLEGAIAKYKQALALEATVGTLLNLGDAYERLDRKALAWETFDRAAILAHEKNDDREAESRSRATKLERSIAFFEPTWPSSHASVRLDGQEIQGRPKRLAVEPGAHAFVIEEGGARRTVDRRIAIGEMSAVDLTAPEPIVPKVIERPPPPPETPPATTGTSPLEWTGIVTAGVGVASIAVGTVFGIVAKNKRGTLDDLCPSYPRCALANESNVRDTYDSANRAAGISTATFIAGGILLATGITIWLVAPKAVTAGAAPVIRW